MLLDFIVLSTPRVKSKENLDVCGCINKLFIIRLYKISSLLLMPTMTSSFTSLRLPLLCLAAIYIYLQPHALYYAVVLDGLLSFGGLLLSELRYPQISS